MKRFNTVVPGIAVLTLLFSSVGWAQRLKPESRIVSQADAPVNIISYNARYDSGSSSGLLATRAGIQHNLTYQNVSTKNIVAIQFGLVAFDVWNEFLDRTAGFAWANLAPQKSGSGGWTASRYADFSFQTGVAYVSRVRFESGEIWAADLDMILNELKKIQKDFDAANLNKKDSDK
jgi:hypothetical protein